jgi:hypothetical protein
VDEEELARLLREQDGVIARWQALAVGATDSDIERRLRRREWARVSPGVYVDHTGPLAWRQRAWAAVLAVWPAALDGRSALRAHGLREPAEPRISVVVDHSRRVDARPVRRSTAFATEVQANLAPPRVRLEVAVLRVAALAATEDDAVAVVADACQSRRTTPSRLLSALDGIGRIRHRRLLTLILVDAASGAYSALERRYLLRVERAHGLPAGSRQRRVVVGTKPYYRDVEYVGLSSTVELDGRLGHELARDRWDDLERDLAGVRRGDVTMRIGWRQVLEPHRLAVIVGEVLLAQGWDGVLRPCAPGCAVNDARGGSPAPGAGDPPAR